MVILLLSLFVRVSLVRTDCTMWRWGWQM